MSLTVTIIQNSFNSDILKCNVILGNIAFCHLNNICKSQFLRIEHSSHVVQRIIFHLLKLLNVVYSKFHLVQYGELTYLPDRVAI